MKYTPNTGEIVAICDEPLSTGNIYPFWVPGDNHIAYWNGGVRVFDFSTGNRFILPSRGFVGWVPMNSE
jgi:hypothetical protein